MKLNRHLAIGMAIAVFTLLISCSRPQAPDARYVRLDGSHARIGDFKGKVLLVNFWATSCATCVKEMPQLVATYQKYHSQGYETLAVAMKSDPPAYVMNFAETRKLPFVVTMDHAGEMARSFGDVILTPTSFLINRHGEIVKRYVGEPDFASLHQLVEELLAET